MKRPFQPIRRPDLWPAAAAQALVTPLQPSVVYRSDDPDALDRIYGGSEPGFTYAREAHPNAAVLAARLDEMEAVDGGIMTSSGMAAITLAMLALCRAGDHIIAAQSLYGRSLRLLRDDLPRFGISVSLVDPSNAQNFEEAYRPETRAILTEVVANPTLRVADLRGIGAFARAKGLHLVVDNTFTTPRALQPVVFGADVVVHSVTKLLAGHSDATLGYIAACDQDVQTTLTDTAITFGLTASPFDCWLAERGLYSFDLRYDRAEASAARIADGLAHLPGIRRVLYPMRSDHPDHARAVDLLGARGGTMVSFEIAGGRDAANALVRAAADLAFAPTLGDIASTLSHPCTSSHRGVAPEKRAALGITEGFFRLSVGVEDPDNMVDLLSQAIHAATQSR